jgi:hypothetical protein
MKSLRVKLAAGVAVLGVAGVATAAIAHDRSRFSAGLTGYEEVAAISTLSTSGSGSFSAQLNRGKDEIRYTLSYRGPFDAKPAGGTVAQAHIHLGARGISGGISAFLCSNLGNGPAGTPACPAEGTVTGTITPLQVVGGAEAQGLAAGEFAELVRALRAGAAYANVHTSTFPGGEIRGQIEDDDDRRGH